MLRVRDDTKKHWLNATRLKLYVCTGLVTFLIVAVGVIYRSNLINPKGFQLLSDFSVFWSVSHLALTGAPEKAYTPAILHQIVQTIADDGGRAYGWFYPPTFYLIILPLALMPHMTAYLVFTLITLAGYATVIWRIFPKQETMWVLMAFSGVWINIRAGQNGFLTAALCGVALICLEERPLLAGILVGLMAIKPQLAVLFPVALIAAGAWRTLLMSILTGTLFVTASIAVLGDVTFRAWLHALSLPGIYLASGYLPLSDMPTVFSFLRLLGASVSAAYLGHALVAIGATVSLWRVWRHCENPMLRGAALTTATFLVSPYVYNYDLTWLALSIAWLTKFGLAQGWLSVEREILIAAWLLPILSTLVAESTSIQIGPFILLALLGMILRRTGTLRKQNVSVTSVPATEPPR